MNVLIIIPARGGSKGIPRKNLRDLAGKPLLFYSINIALQIENAKIVIDTDDEEIEFMVNNSYKEIPVFMRNKSEGTDTATIDDVIFEHLNVVHYNYDTLVVLQPTSPLLSAQTLREALVDFYKYDYESAIAVKEFQHLLWQNNKYGVPNLVQSERVNRQQMEKLYLETGSITITKKNLIEKGVRIGSEPALITIPASESLDLDTADDWLLAERAINKNMLYIYVEGNKKIGLGHIYNVLELAMYFASFSIRFITNKSDEIANNILKTYNYKVITCEKNELPNLLKKEKGIRRLVIDSLDSSDELLKSLAELNVRVVSFEDRNIKFLEKRIVINALYSGHSDSKKYYGFEYFIMRREFTNRKKHFSKKINEVLISFGGADPQNYTELCYRLLRENFAGNITMIIGTANNRKYIVDKKTKVLRNITNMSHYMYHSDIAFTSAGRTSIECAAIGLTAVVLNQNDRELEHEFAQEQTGFLRSSNVGISSDELKNLIQMIFDVNKRHELWQKMKSLDFHAFTLKTIELIKKHIG